MMVRWIKRMKNGVVKFCKDHKVEIIGVLVGTAVVGTGAVVCRHVDEQLFMEGKYIVQELGEGPKSWDSEEISEK